MKVIMLAAFFVPAVLLTAVYAGLGFYPFGDKSVLIMDLADQYVEFFASLRYTLNGENSLLFSWSRSMGGNFMGLAAYYIASPLSFITLFFSLDTLPAGILLLMILKTGLCGLSCAAYLEYGWNKGAGKFKTILFASCYALMSYVIVYGMCVMWLDGLIFLPLILLGVEKLMENRKGLVFLISLAALFVCNYYTAYMVGIFTAIYVVYRTLCKYTKEQWKQVLKIYIKFGWNTILAFGLAAPMLIPTAKDLVSGKLSTAQYIPENKYSFQLVTFFERLFGGEYDSITNGGMPLVFCGILMLVLVVIFFFLEKINWKEKLGAALIFAFLIASFWIVDLDLAWHAFRFPTWFPHRYAFVFSAFVIIIAHRASMYITIPEKYKAPSARPVVAFCIAMIVIFQTVDLYNNAKENIIGLDNQFTYKQMSDYTAFVDKYGEIVSEVEALDDGFYRMEKDEEFSKNDAMLLGYNGMTHYSSTFHAGINAFTGGLGIAQAHIWNSGYGSTPVTDSIFNVKYRMSAKTVEDTYKAVLNKENVTVYENTTVLPIAFAAGKFDTVAFGSDTFANQNQFLNKLAGTEDVQYFEMVDYTKEQDDVNWSYKVQIQDNNPLYLRMFGNTGWATVYRGDTFVGNHFSSETNCNLFLGEKLKGESVQIRCETDNVICTSELLYKLHTDRFREAYNKLKEGQLELTRQKGSTIEGTIHVGEGQMVFTSIPYDDGFKVKVDGKEVEKTAVSMNQNGEELKVFLTFPAEAGEHTISITYCPPGLMAGIGMAFVAVFVSLAYYNSDRLALLLKGRKSENQ